jgi:hypothetical protein
MKAMIYVVLALAVVPLQSTLWHAVSIGGVRPDLGLIAACLVGFLGGELDGLLLGCVLGLSQDIFSAGELWLNVVTKGGAGFLAGLVGRQVAHLTPMVLFVAVLTVSALSGALVIYTMNLKALDDIWFAVGRILVPQAFFDASMGAGLYWVVQQRISVERFLAEDRF